MTKTPAFRVFTILGRTSSALQRAALGVRAAIPAHRRFLCLTAVTLSAACCGYASPAVIVVTGGKLPVNDWTLEQALELDWLASQSGIAARLDPERVGVLEVDAHGAKIASVVSQVDATETSGRYVVCWRMPGKLAPGARRYFRIVFDRRREPGALQDAVSVRTDGDSTVVTNGALILTHDKGAGGMITRAQIDGVAGSFSWPDRVYDGTCYYLTSHAAAAARVTAAGPLRVAYEAESEYLDGARAPASRPRAVYRFTHYAGQPVTRVSAVATQDFAKRWQETRFLEAQFAGAPVRRVLTDKHSAELGQAGKSYGGRNWAAVYGDNYLVGILNSPNPNVYDGGGEFYGGYVIGGWPRWSSRTLPLAAAIFWGSGEQDIESLKAWSAALADPPRAEIRVETLQQEIEEIAHSLEEKERLRAALSGEDWTVAHVSLVLADRHLKAASASLAGAAFSRAEDAILRARSALTSKIEDAHVTNRGGVVVGLVAGYPCLANRKVAFVWSRPEHGAGLVSIYDIEIGREFLNVDPTQASLWRLSGRTPTGVASWSNLDSACQVDQRVAGDAPGGRLTFTWRDAVNVQLNVSLSASATRLRSRLRVSSEQNGLLTVTYPDIRGIAPLSANAREDVVLETAEMGCQRVSPLVSGKVSAHYYPGGGMQFTSLLGSGLGLYFGEEDGQANKKDLVWTPDTEAGALGFHISHPVRRRSADERVAAYSSPGDVVFGPFHGDWFDAARLYREWAVTAPWCSKGPIASRPDYPRWLADAAYWTIGSPYCETTMERQSAIHEFFGLPAHILHTYGWWMTDAMDNKYPEYFPPRLGSRGFAAAVGALQAQGVRVVPYVNGSLWDIDTESYAAENAEANGASLTSAGKIIIAHYGGQEHANMCPGSPLWRSKLLAISKELAGRYGVDGVYFDFLTAKDRPCWNTRHGHPVQGGDFWAKAVGGLYREIRSECRKLNPEFMLTGENAAEFCIDALDTFLVHGYTGTIPLFNAVYHGYTLVFGGTSNRFAPLPQHIGRWWLMGNQNGWHNWELVFAKSPAYSKPADYYRKLLQCHHRFARPYLAYGEMLRPPNVSGDLPVLDGNATEGPYTVPAVEGSAWRAPEGSVGVFFLNYDDDAHEFTWRVDLSEIVGWDAARQLRLSEWADGGLRELDDVNGGVLTRTMSIAPWGLAAFKLEEIP